MLSKTETDTLADFKDIYDFDEAFGKFFENLEIKEIQ